MKRLLSLCLILSAFLSITVMVASGAGQDKHEGRVLMLSIRPSSDEVNAVLEQLPEDVRPEVGKLIQEAIANGPVNLSQVETKNIADPILRPPGLDFAKYVPACDGQAGGVAAVIAGGVFAQWTNNLTVVEIAPPSSCNNLLGCIAIPVWTNPSAQVTDKLWMQNLFVEILGTFCSI